MYEQKLTLNICSLFLCETHTQMDLFVTSNETKNEHDEQIFQLLLI